MILHGKHLIKAWTKQQSIVATSTAEAELYRAATESMGVQAFAKDLGRVVTIRLHIDSSAALSYNKQNRVGQSEAHRDSAPVASGGGAQREARCGEDPHRDKLFGPGNKALDEREI